MPPKTNDPDTKHDMNKKEAQGAYWTPESQFPSESPIKSDPRYKSEKRKNAIEEEIQGLLQSGAFAFVNKNIIEKNSNILGGRFILAIEQPGTEH